MTVLTAVKWCNPLVWWRKMQRRMDRQILIPVLMERAGNSTLFAKAFALHVSMDTAWQVPDWQLNSYEIRLMQVCIAVADDGFLSH